MFGFSAIICFKTVFIEINYENFMVIFSPVCPKK